MAMIKSYTPTKLSWNKYPFIAFIEVETKEILISTLISIPITANIIPCFF